MQNHKGKSQSIWDLIGNSGVKWTLVIFLLSYQVAKYAPISVRKSAFSDII